MTYISHPKRSISVSSFVGEGRASPKEMRSRHQREQEQLKQEHQRGGHDAPVPTLSPQTLLASADSILIYTCAQWLLCQCQKTLRQLQNDLSEQINV